MYVSDARALAEDWVTFWRHRFETGGFREETAALDNLAREDPELCWSGILEVIELIAPDPTHADALIGVLAAGPLEDLIELHIEAFIKRMEDQAARDTRFANILGGVWDNVTSSELLARLDAIRGDRW